jgi:hypothetical protein
MHLTHGKLVLHPDGGRTKGQFCLFSLRDTANKMPLNLRFAKKCKFYRHLSDTLLSAAALTGIVPLNAFT